MDWSFFPCLFAFKIILLAASHTWGTPTVHERICLLGCLGCDFIGFLGQIPQIWLIFKEGFESRAFQRKLLSGLCIYLFRRDGACSCRGRHSSWDGSVAVLEATGRRRHMETGAAGVIFEECLVSLGSGKRNLMFADFLGPPRDLLLPPSLAQAWRFLMARKWPGQGLPVRHSSPDRVQAPPACPLPLFPLPSFGKGSITPHFSGAS